MSNARISTSAIAHIALPGALAISTGCQAITTIFEAGVGVGVLTVLLILGILAYVVSRFRGGGGAPRGTVTILIGVLLTGSLLTAGPALASELQAVPRPQGGRPEVEQPVGEDQRAGKATGTQRAGSVGPMEDVLLQGCVARDDGWRPAGSPSTGRADRAGASTASAGDRGEVFVLRQASRMAADARGGRAGATQDVGGPGETYRLVPGSGVSLSTHEKQHVEIRGRLDERRDTTATAPASSATSPRDSQAVQGGQMQGVGQTMASGQGGQSGQSTAPPPDAARAGGGVEGSTGDAVPTVIVTSVRMLAPSCPERR